MKRTDVTEWDVLFVAFVSLLYVSALMYAHIANTPKPIKLYAPVSHIELPVQQPIMEVPLQEI
jgi:hypothetical protein